MPATQSPWILKYAPLICSHGRVLDLACGSGRHARWLAAQGYVVDAIDRDATVLATMADLDNIHFKLPTSRLRLDTSLPNSMTVLSSAAIYIVRYFHG